MPIDVEAALAASPDAVPITWTERDVLLYHLSLGAGVRAGEPELRYVHEAALAVLPTFALVAGLGVSSGTTPTMPLEVLQLDIDMVDLLHAGQSLDVRGPIPSSGRALLTTRVQNVWDKGKAAVVEVTQSAADDTGDELWVSTMQMWVRGAGGFGGDGGPSPAPRDTSGAPDREFVMTTRPDQAMLYRLNGDLNPLHVDPAFATAAGLERPILHGLASFGIVAKGVVDEFLDGDPSSLSHVSGRFSGPVFPGESLRTRVWQRDDELLLETTCPERGDVPVLSHAVARGAQK